MRLGQAGAVVNVTAESRQAARAAIVESRRGADGRSERDPVRISPNPVHWSIRE